MNFIDTADVCNSEPTEEKRLEPPLFSSNGGNLRGGL